MSSSVHPLRANSDGEPALVRADPGRVGGVLGLLVLGIVLTAVFSLGADVVVGIADGSIYALAALGLVLTYKTSGIFNFAIGAQAAASAYVFYSLRVTVGLPWPLAAFCRAPPRRAGRIAHHGEDRLLAHRRSGRHEGRGHHRVWSCSSSPC